MRTIKEDTVSESQTTLSVKCGAHTGPVSERIPVLFEPSDDEPVWPSGIQINEEQTTIPSGSSCSIQVNFSKQLPLNKRTVVGTLNLIKSPLEIRLKQSRKLD